MTISDKLTDFQILALSLAPKIGRKTLYLIANKISFCPANTSELHEALNEASKELSRFQLPDISALIKAEESAKRLLDNSTQNNIKLIGLFNKNFPPALKIIPNPPTMVFIKGNLNDALKKICVAVIGTRDPSEYGMRWAERLGAYLAKKGLGVVSGLALGCDAEGHKGCLQEKGYALAVLAHGLDKIHPAANRSLGEEILDSGGCLLSEYPPGMPPQRNFFVERDRLQSGMSSGVIIVETDIKGGSMHTASFAIEQQRKLACLKHPEKYDKYPKAQGNISLISQGKAQPILTEEDLQIFLGGLKGIHSDINTTSKDENTTELKTSKKPEQLPIFK